jgi:hypothetical protein
MPKAKKVKLASYWVAHPYSLKGATPERSCWGPNGTNPNPDEPKRGHDLWTLRDSAVEYARKNPEVLKFSAPRNSLSVPQMCMFAQFFEDSDDPAVATCVCTNELGVACGAPILKGEGPPGMKNHLRANHLEGAWRAFRQLEDMYPGMLKMNLEQLAETQTENNENTPRHAVKNA